MHTQTNVGSFRLIYGIGYILFLEKFQSVLQLNLPTLIQVDIKIPFVHNHLM